MEGLNARVASFVFSTLIFPSSVIARKPAAPCLLPLRAALAALCVFAGAPSRGQDATRGQFFTRPESAPREEPPPSELREGQAAPATNLHVNPEAQGGAARTVSVGPVAFKLGLMGAIEYSDNVRVERIPVPGMMVSAGINVEGMLAVSRRQELTLMAVINQRTPLFGPGKRERLYSVSPNSVVRFQLWVKDVRLTPFFKYSRQLDPVLSPVVNRTRILDQTGVTKGVQGDVPLGWGGVQLIALRERRSQRGDESLSQNAWTDSAGARGILNLSRRHTLMADFVLARTRFVGGPSARTSGRSFSFADEWQISEGKSLTASYGYGEQRFVDPRTEGDTLFTSSPFYSLAYRHTLRENLKANVRYARSTQEGVATNFYHLHDLSVTPEYKCTERINFNFTAGHQWIGESGPLGEEATRLTLNVAGSYALAAKSDLRLSYDYTFKRSTIATREYLQNRVTFMANHQF